MSEMKIWVTPEVEVQTFQANEYVTGCYTSTGYSNQPNGFWEWLLSLFVGNSEALFYYDDQGKLVQITGSIDPGSIGSTSNLNSGTLYNEVYIGTREWVQTGTNNGWPTYGWTDWEISETPSDLKLFDPAQSNQIYVGTFTEADPNVFS